MYSAKYKYYQGESSRNKYRSEREPARISKNSSYIEKKYGNLDEQDYYYRQPYLRHQTRNGKDRSSYRSPKSKEQNEYDYYYSSSGSGIASSYKEASKPRNRKTINEYEMLRELNAREYESRKPFTGNSFRYQKSPSSKYDLSISVVSAHAALDYRSSKKSYYEQNLPEHLTRSNVDRYHDKSFEKRSHKSPYGKHKNFEKGSNIKQKQLTNIPEENRSTQFFQSSLKKGGINLLPHKDAEFDGSISQLSTQYSLGKSKTDYYQYKIDKIKDDIYRTSIKEEITGTKQSPRNTVDNRFAKKKYNDSGFDDLLSSGARSALSKSKIGRTDSKSKLETSFKVSDFQTSKASSYVEKDAKPKRVQTKWSIQDFRLAKTKGEGKFGTVYMAFHKLTEAVYAIKKISKQIIKSHMLQNQLALEIKLQMYINHPNILKLYGFFDDQDSIYLVLEYMEEGTLFEYLKKKIDKLTEKEVAVKVKQVSSAIKYLHDLDIAHRDIKPQNIVISNGVAKICDFGWATRCTDRRKTYCGTFDYAAPEILEGKQYDWCVDLWCLGVLTFELLTGKVPFYHVSRKETMKKILRVDRDQVTYPPEISPKAKSFVESLIKKDPEQRSTANELLGHPFLAEIKDNHPLY